jgi:hypothetical protein
MTYAAELQNSNSQSVLNATLALAQRTARNPIFNPADITQRSETMAFKNEYIPPIEQEPSEFFKKARKTLNTGYSQFDRWTIDREREMVLFKDGSGHSLESHTEEYWSFLNSQARYACDTNLISKAEISSEEIAITRSIGFRGDPANHPDAETLKSIKAALREYKDWGVESNFKSSRLTLLSAATGEEI